jgi:hypothetical protein
VSTGHTANQDMRALPMLSVRRKGSGGFNVHGML